MLQATAATARANVARFPRVPRRSARRMIQSFADETVADLFRECKTGTVTSR